MRKGWHEITDETRAFDSTELNRGPLLHLTTIQYEENRFVGAVNNSWWPDGEFMTLDEAQKATEELAHQLLSATVQFNKKEQSKIDRFLDLSIGKASIWFVGLVFAPIFGWQMTGKWWGAAIGLGLGFWSTLTFLRRSNK